MRHCYSTGDDLLLASNACKPHLAKLLGYIKIYVLDIKFWLLYWRPKYFTSTGVKDFLTKSENSSSKFHREVRWLSPTSLLTVPRVQEEAGLEVRMRGEQQPARPQKCCKLWGRGWDLQCRSLQKKERCDSEDSFMMQYTWRRARSFPIKASSGKRFSRSVKETIFLWLLKDCSLDAAATRAEAVV